MYRGSRPHRGAFPPASRGYGPRGPPPASGHFFPRAPYWDDHGRSRNGFPRDYHGPPEQHRRSPPRRRYASPGREDSRGDGPTSRDYGHRYSPSPPRGGLPVDHSLVITVGNELNNMSRDYPSRSSYDGHGARSRSRSTERMRSKSRPRSRSRSRSRGRAVSRNRALSRGRSKSRHCSRSRSRSRSRGQSRARSRARSKSRACSRSRSRSRSKSRNRGRSRARSHERGRSRSSSSSSSYNRREDFRELEMARRRKELEHMLTMPTKSILKKRVGSSETDSPMMTSNSPQGQSGSDLSQEAKELLSAMTKNMDPELLATTLSQSSNSDAINELLSKLQPAKESGCEFSQPHERGCQDSADLGQLLSVMAEAVAQPLDKKKRFEDIEDEEKFLYGDEEEEDKFSAKGLTKAGQSSLLDVYGESGADVQRSEYGTSSYGRGGSAEDEEIYTEQLEKHIKEEGADYPPGVGPNDAKDREKVEEYEKIQDLLKTIGLDLGVAEISKMAARTQERLHGMKPAKNPPARRQSEWKHRSRSRSYSSTSSSSGSRSRGRSSSRSNSSRSRSSSRSHSRSRSSSRERISNRSRKEAVHPERRSSQSGSHSQTEVRSVSKAGESSWAKPQTPDVVSPGTTAATFPALPSHHASPYPQPHQPRVMPPNFHPPAYNPYGNYMPYMPQGWPMYPPPVPPQSPLDDFKSTAIERPYLKVIDTGANNGGKMDKKGSKVETLQSSSQNQRKVVEKNNASQKQKVLQELQKLKMDRETRQKKKDRLIKELETLRKQQGELLRKKRREKDGHKDPILMELGRLQEDVMEQISFLRSEHEAAEKKHDELIKVATILGLDHKKIQITVEREHSPPQSRCKETDRSPEKPKATAAAAPSASNKGTKTPVPTSDAQIPDTSAELFEYYDAGNHWCKNCNSTSGSMFDFFTHLHSKTHRKSLDPYDRPWAEKSEKSEKKHSKAEPISKPAKGSEFLIPVRGFYCQLCEDFFGDPICAEAHVTSYAHNEKYKKQMFENPLYEQRRNLDRQAGMESERKQADLKRKRDGGDSPEDQKKSAKDVKNFKGKDDVDRIKHSKEEEPKAKNIRKEENKPKSLKEECERTKYRKEEEDSSRYAREEEEERNKYRKDEEEKYRHRRDEEERYRYDEGRYRYKYKEDDRYRYKKEDERYKHGRDDEKKSKYGREAEEGKIKYREEEGVKWPKSKWEDDEEERTTYEKKDKWQRQKDAPSRHKDEKEAAPAKDGKTEPEKPSEPRKVMCGPNPAIFAKLRKKSEDSTVRPSFGKFNWKKPEKTALEKEAEKIAAQFIKEDEAAAAQDEATDADAFAKSVAAAKSIAIKLSGKTAIPPSNEWLAFNQNLSPKPRPSLPPPPPTNILRKTNIGVQSKSVPLNPITSEDSNDTAKTKTEMKEPVLSANLSSQAFGGEDLQLNPVSGDSTDPTPTTTSKTTPVPPPSPIEKEVVTVQPTPSVECVVSLKSDVAAPGVPEEEQNLTVLVRPPPQPKSQAKANDSLKSNKPKPTLAAAKAKDLFDIFYSGSSMMAGTSVGKKTAPETDSGTQASAQAEASQQVQDPHPKDSNDLKESKCQEQPMNQATTCEQPAEEELYSSSGTQAGKDTETLEMTKSEEISESMEGLGYSTEVNTLECEVNSEILENIVIMETSDNQDEGNPLNPEEVLTVSFSPPPGSFTEQINLDTFEFSFEPL